jgi:hypothetical protein
MQTVTVTQPPNPSVPSAGTVLPPNANGYVFIETKSGKTHCLIATDHVACEAEFTNAPIISGQQAHDISVNRDGTSEWVIANLGLLEGRFTLDYQTYQALGWTIVADSTGTTFTNNQTHHGMFVTIDEVRRY